VSEKEEENMKRQEKKKPRRKKEKAKTSKSEYSCNVCGEEFETRNSMFTHVREKAHALAKEGGSSSATNKKAKGKKK
jgi:hypothetical protein